MLLRIFLGIFCIHWSAAAYAYCQAEITVCFRCDDVSGAIEKPWHNVSLYKAIFEAFRRAGIPLTVGVIPLEDGKALLTADHPVARLLREYSDLGVIDVGVHGLTHLPLSRDSEWLGVPSEVQRVNAAIGLSCLSQIGLRTRPTVFCPPWNSFDVFTLGALREQGITHLTGDVGIIRKRPFVARTNEEKCLHGIKVVPATCSLQELPQVLNLSRQSSSGTVVVVIFHPYDFDVQHYIPNLTVSHADCTLEGILSQATSGGRVQCKRVRDLNDELSTDRFVAACRYTVLLRMYDAVLPPETTARMGLRDKGEWHWLANGRYLERREYESRERLGASVLAVASVLSVSVIMWLCLRSARRRILAIATVFSAVSAGLYGESSYQLFTSEAMRTIASIYVVQLAIVLCAVVGHWKITSRRRQQSARGGVIHEAQLANVHGASRPT